MKITGKENKQWSRLGSRATYGQAILMLAEKLHNLMVLSADLGNSSGLDRFKATYPDKFLNIGIAEQNMIGVAAGLAKEGSVVFASSFAPFITMRAAEQVRMNMGYMDLNIKTVAIGSGVSMSFLGNSHFGLEDAAIMRSIPNMTVVSPADCAEIVKTVFAAAVYPHPMYIRLTGAVGFPVVYEDDYDFHAFIFSDNSGFEVYRKDIDKNELKVLLSNESEDHFSVCREFTSVVKPTKWILWPHSESKGWLDKMENKI